MHLLITPPPPPKWRGNLLCKQTQIFALFNEFMYNCVLRHKIKKIKK